MEKWLGVGKQQIAPPISTMTSNSWFQGLFGFTEPINSNVRKEVQKNFVLKTDRTGETFLQSKLNSKSYPVGKFLTPTLGELQSQGKSILASESKKGSHSVCFRHEAVGDILEMHALHEGALFQAASQFNCLEMAHPQAVPEDGVSIYAFDATQGPACATACAAGTVYRNYFLELVDEKGKKQVGQSTDLQLNTLADIEAILDNDQNHYWRIKNGYSFSDQSSLAALSNILDSPETDLEMLRQSLRIGFQLNVGVTFARKWVPPATDVRVSQAYCSALSCSYSGIGAHHWKPLAKLILDATYEATLWAGVVNNASSSRGTNKVFLTFIGGGVFGNKKGWIGTAIGRALAKLHAAGASLDVVICHYRTVDETIVTAVQRSFEANLELFAAMSSPSSVASMAVPSEGDGEEGAEGGRGVSGKGSGVGRKVLDLDAQVDDGDCMLVKDTRDVVDVNDDAVAEAAPKEGIAPHMGSKRAKTEK